MHSVQALPSLPFPRAISGSRSSWSRTCDGLASVDRLTHLPCLLIFRSRDLPRRLHLAQSGDDPSTRRHMSLVSEICCLFSSCHLMRCEGSDLCSCFLIPFLCLEPSRLFSFPSFLTRRAECSSKGPVRESSRADHRTSNRESRQAHLSSHLLAHSPLASG